MFRCLLLTALFLIPIATIDAADWKKGVVFAKRGDRELKLDIAFHGVKQRRPAVLCIHGGGWAAGNRGSFRRIMDPLVATGYVAVTVDYRLTNVAPWPAQIKDVRDAFQWMITNADRYGIDPERIAVAGESAGGHLALMLGMMPSEGDDGRRVRGIVNLYGPTDMREIETVAHARNLVEALVGGKLEDKREMMNKVSPIVYVDRTDPPVLTLHGTEDKLVSFLQARKLHEELKRHKIPRFLFPMKGVGHGLGKDKQRYRREIESFLENYLRGSDMPLIAAEDFNDGAARWQATDKSAWKTVSKAGQTWYSLVRNSKYKPKVRSPLNISLLKDVTVGDFVLDVDLRSTNKPYGHQDLCLFFGHQDPSHFYYVHIGRNADPHANSIFLVNGKPRVSIAKTRTKGTDWSRGWHRARIRRTVSSGKIEVFFDNMKEPVMVAVDKSFQYGKIGVGSFDDTGDFDAIRLWGRKVAQ